MTAGKRKRRGCGCCGCPGCLLPIAVLLWAVVALWHGFKPLPPGLRLEGEPIRVAPGDMQLLADVTALNPQGLPFSEHVIFDRMLHHIDHARTWLLADNFYFNSFSGPAPGNPRSLSNELSTALVDAKRSRPQLEIILLTDPINEIYGGAPKPHLEALRDAGVTVVSTDLDGLRDSNPLYSAWWRMGPRWLGASGGGGVFPNPFDPDAGSVSLRSWLSLLNFKANHRKVFVADDGDDGWISMVGSLNAHDGSSANSNLAIEVRSAALARQLWRSEAAVLRLSGTDPPEPPMPEQGKSRRDETTSITLLTEGAIRDRLIEELGAAGEGSRIDVAVFYLSHARVIDALVAAAHRGAEIRVLLDPSKDAFERTKNGIPNRQSAGALTRRGRGRIEVRWYDTHGEQFHPKTACIRGPDTSTLLIGSANFTRRNLDDFNLETDVLVEGDPGDPLDLEFQRWFERLWFNEGLQATAPFEKYRDDSVVRRVTATIQERTGLCTF